MKKLSMAALILFLTVNACSVWASDYSFSGYTTNAAKALVGVIDKSRRCDISFFISSRTAVTVRFTNTGTSSIDENFFSSAGLEIVAKDGKAYEVSLSSASDRLPGLSNKLINPGETVERIFYNNNQAVRDVITSQKIDRLIFVCGIGTFILRQQP